MASEDWGKELIEYLSLFHISCLQFSLLIYLGGTLSLAFSDLCIYRVTCYSLHALPSSLAFLIPSLTHPNPIPLLSPDHLSLLPLSVHFLLTPHFEEQILVQPYQFLPCFAWFPTHWDGELLCSKKGGLKELPALVVFCLTNTWQGLVKCSIQNCLKGKRGVMKVQIMTVLANNCFHLMYLFKVLNKPYCPYREISVISCMYEL